MCERKFEELMPLTLATGNLKPSEPLSEKFWRLIDETDQLDANLIFSYFLFLVGKSKSPDCWDAYFSSYKKIFKVDSKNVKHLNSIWETVKFRGKTNNAPFSESNCSKQRCLKLQVIKRMKFGEENIYSSVIADNVIKTKQNS